MQAESAINLTNYDDGSVTVSKPGILERNFSKSTVKKIKTFGFFFQHIFLEIALPLILYFTLKDPLGQLYATIISSIPSLLSTLWTIIIKRRFEPLPIILVLSFFIGLGLSLGFKDAKLNQVQGPIVTSIIGISYIVTLGCKKPIIYYFSRPWMTKNDPEKIKEFDLSWESPNYRSAMKTVSIVWGLGFILQAAGTFVLIFTVNLDLVMILGHVLLFGTIGILIIWSAIYKIYKTKQAQNNTQQVSAYRV
jgi:intracellular septation protein A